MAVVIVPDPDDERGVRAVRVENGRVVAKGHLEIDGGDEILSNAAVVVPLSLSLRFVATEVTP